MSDNNMKILDINKISEAAGQIKSLKKELGALNDIVNEMKEGSRIFS